MPVVGGFKHALVSDGTGLNVENSTLRGCPLGVATEVKTCRVLPRCYPKDLAVNTQKNRGEIRNPKQKVAGAPEEIRTPDPQIRSLKLSKNPLFDPIWPIGLRRPIFLRAPFCPQFSCHAQSEFVAPAANQRRAGFPLDSRLHFGRSSCSRLIAKCASGR